MDASDPTKITGRGHNDDKMRSTHHDIPRSFVTRTAEIDLSKDGLGTTRPNRTEIQYTGISHTE